MPNTLTKPRWNAAKRELWWDGRLVYPYHRFAPNQWAVLDAFEAAGWPPWIDEPPRRGSGKKPKSQRHETIQSLNRTLRDTPIRFHADGARGGVSWELAT